MNITHNTKDNKLILRLSGRFDFRARHVFQTAMEEIKKTTPREIILNLTQVSFIDSAALGLMALSYEKLNSANQRLILVASQGYVLKVLELANFQKKMSIVATEEEACGSPG